MMASRDTLDNRLDAYKDQAKTEQNDGRGNKTWGYSFGQVLRENGRPSDQPEDGPQLPALLKSDAWIDVYESPAGFGWMLVAEADEAGTLYRKSLTSHEGGEFVESAWEVFVPEVL
jgi:hypothetical protein